MPKPWYATPGHYPQRQVVTALVQAARHMEYRCKLNDITKCVQLGTQGRLENVFRHLPPQAFRTGYLVFPNLLPARQPDLARKFMCKYLWYHWNYSEAERERRPEGYFAHETPEGYSPVVDWFSRIVVTFAAGAYVIVPIVIMTVTSGSKTKELVVLSAAAVIFGVSVSWILQSRGMDILAATTDYTAVLAIFYGNVVNNNGSSTGSSPTGS